MNKGKLRYLTFEERLVIERLLSRGISLELISFELNRAKSTITTEISLNGGKEKYSAEEGQKRRNDQINKIGSFQHKSDSLTIKERELIESLLKENLTGSEIARKLNRSKNTINSEIRRNGGRLNYSGEKAQIKSDLIRGSVLEKQRSTNNIVLDSKDKIEALEMQVQILLETIQEMKGNA